MNLSADSAATTDLLGRDQFAAQIVKSLNTTFESDTSSLVVGISGNWGSGKSTLLNFIKRHLSNTYTNKFETYRVLEFNSWGNATEENLERNFLKTIADSLSEMTMAKKVDKASDKIKSYLKHFQRLKFISHAHPLVNNIFQGLDEYLKQGDMRSLADIKSNANKLLQENKVKLYILIDDLDRLTPKEITILFKLLKVNLNLYNTVFILAYEKEVVVKALENEYGFNGERYLEKIIQVDFTMPAIQTSQLEKLFFQHLSELLQKLNIEIDEQNLLYIWKMHGLNEYFSSIRDLNRYFNNLIFTLPNIASDVKIADFLLLEAIRTFDYVAYKSLYSSFMLLSRKALWESTDINDLLASGQWLPTTSSMLNFLFIHRHGQKNDPSEKRLRHPDYFERYFSLSLPVSDISEARINQFFVANSNKASILKSILEEGKMENFLSRIASPGLPFTVRGDGERVLSILLEFWNNRSGQIPYELRKNLVKSFYQIVALCEDTFQATKQAVRALEMNSQNQQQDYSFLMNLDILRSGKSRPEAEAIKEQYHLNPDYFIRFGEFLESSMTILIMKIRQGNTSWIDNHYLWAIANYLPDKYVELLRRQINEPSFVNYLIKNNFLLTDEDGRAGDINQQSISILLPGNFISQVLNYIHDFPNGAVSELDDDNLHFFADRYTQINDLEP